MSGYDEERWDWNGPEEGDGDETVVIMFDGNEIIEVRGDGDVEMNKETARHLCAVLNGSRSMVML